MKATCDVWITLLTSMSVDKVTSGLVRLGYSVESLGNSLVAGDQDMPSAVLAVRIAKENLEEKSTLDEIENLIEEEDVLYHSLILSSPKRLLWLSSNICLSEIKHRFKKPDYLSLVRSDKKDDPE